MEGVEGGEDEGMGDERLGTGGIWGRKGFFFLFLIILFYFINNLFLIST